MITWNIENIVASTVESLLPIHSDPKKGLMICLEFSLTCHNEEDVYYSNRIVEFVFQRPTNYTKVFSRVLDLKGNVLKDWKLTSDHDSCWRSDGLRDVFQTYMEVRKDMEKQNSAYDFREDEVNIQSPRFGSYISFVDVEIEKDPNDSYNYNLVSVKTKTY